MRKAINLAVIVENRILLVRRGDVWILPGGGEPGPGESDKDCLRRKLKEELGLNPEDFEIEDYYGSFDGETPHKKDVLEARVYLGRIKSQIIPSNEITDARLFGLNFYDTSEITKEIIKSFRERRYLR